MPDFFINGKPVHAENGQTVMQAATANGFYIPYFCWHPKLSVHGNCRICCVEVEDDKGGEGWVEIACNMPVTEGMRVLTDSDKVKARRKATLQFITLNHPVDCGICDKAGECMLQDAHYEYNGDAVDVARSEAARDQVLPAVEAHHARQRALHLLLALRALHARDLEDEQPSRCSSAATRRSCGRSRTAASTTTRIRRTSSTCARSAHCCPIRSTTSRASGT